MVDFPQELTGLLKEKVGFTDKEISDYFKLNENEKEWILTTKEWLETSTYTAMRELCEQKGGAYTPNPPTFFIPKEGREVGVPATSEGEGAPNEQLETVVGPQPVTVKLSQLQYGVFSPRKTNKRWIEHLTEAIQAEGIEGFPKPKVRIHPDAHNMAETQYQLVDGEHFCRALEELGIKEVPVEVHALTDMEADYKAMRFNQVHGKPLEPIEEARHLKKMMEKYDLSQEQIAKKFLRNQPWVSRRLAMLEVGENNVIQRGITSTHAQEIVKAPEEARQEIVDKIKREELSTRPTSELVQDIKETPEKKAEILATPYDPVGVECSLCHMGTHYPLIREGRKVCSSCADRIDEDPSLIKELKEKPSPPKRKVEMHEYKAPETGEFKRARMKVSPSEVDIAMYERAQQSDEIKKLGYEVILERVYVLTKSDLTFKRADHEKSFWFDHEETHKNKRDSDQEKREFLMKTHPHVQAIGIDYGDTTDKTKNEIWETIMADLKGEHKK